MKYLKTYLYSPNEINFINLNLQESYDHIDYFIICEYNVTTVGNDREYIFEKYKHLINPKYSNKILYFKCDLKHITQKSDTDSNIILGLNEKIMRSYFMKCLDFNDNDIIISVDCDEVIYKESYDTIFKEVEQRDCVRIKLNQLFYKPSYHWTDCDFVAPTIAKYHVYKNDFPCHWRNEGYVLDVPHGCHFSWVMEVDDMITKLFSYGHPEYRSFADKAVLESAIKNKIYPFNLNKPFMIEDLERTSNILPKSIQDTFYDVFWNKFK